MHNIGNIEVDKQAKSLIHKLEIGEQLFMVYRFDLLHRFKFYNELIINKEIKTKTFTNIHPLVAHSHLHLRLYGNACEGKLMDECLLIGCFE